MYERITSSGEEEELADLVTRLANELGSNETTAEEVLESAAILGFTAMGTAAYSLRGKIGESGSVSGCGQTDRPNQSSTD